MSERYVDIIWIPLDSRKLLVYRLSRSKVEDALSCGIDVHNDWEWLKENGDLISIDNPEDYEEVMK